MTYRPDEGQLRQVKAPVVLLRGREGLPFGPPVMAWLESVFGLQTVVISGNHAPFFDTPEVFAEELQPILRRLWS
jgi:pimeloyl-ACP methyl ester carboxylesterase